MKVCLIHLNDVYYMNPQIGIYGILDEKKVE